MITNDNIIQLWLGSSQNGHITNDKIIQLWIIRISSSLHITNDYTTLDNVGGSSLHITNDPYNSIMIQSCMMLSLVMWRELEILMIPSCMMLSLVMWRELEILMIQSSLHITNDNIIQRILHTPRYHFAHKEK